MFDLAIKSGKLDVAETLCKLEAEALHNGEHAFHIAATKDSVDLINYLVTMTRRPHSHARTTGRRCTLLLVLARHQQSLTRSSQTGRVSRQQRQTTGLPCTLPPPPVSPRSSTPSSQQGQSSTPWITYQSYSAFLSQPHTCPARLDPASARCERQPRGGNPGAAHSQGQPRGDEQVWPDADADCQAEEQLRDPGPAYQGRSESVI